MPRLLSNKSANKTEFGNTLSEIRFIKIVLSEIGPDPSDKEIDRAITLAKVDEQHEKMNEEFYKKSEPQISGPMDKYLVKIKQEGFALTPKAEPK